MAIYGIFTLLVNDNYVLGNKGHDTLMRHDLAKRRNKMVGVC